MRLPDNNICTDTSGMLLEKSFGIGDMGLIFDILRTKIYKNPIAAITREISCNARDAHTEVGTPELPIKVFLPNSFSPNFKVQDFGPGITPDRMNNIFINYAASTKREDNTQVGGFGIGSKTPFSYTDNFSVVSITSGIRRTYTAYIDESNIGKMALSEEVEIDEPNGTTIIVPVERKDFRAFEECLIKATEFWPVRPELIGSENQIEYRNYEYHFNEPKWKLFKQKGDSYRRDFPPSIVLIDGIQYDLDTSSIDSFDYQQKDDFAHGFVLTFNIGELKLAASRDNIHYDEPTQKLLVERLIEAKNELIEKISAQIQLAPTYVDACRLYKDLEKTNFTKQMLQGVSWQGNPIKLRILREDIGPFAKVATYMKDRYSGGIKSTRRSSDLAFLNDKDSSLIYQNDKTQTRVSTEVVKYLFEQNPDLKILQVISTPIKPNDEKYERHIQQDPNYKAPYNTIWFDLLEVKKISEIKIPKSTIKALRQARTTTAVDKNKVSVYTIDCHGRYRCPFIANKAQVQKSDEIVYITLCCTTKDLISGGTHLSTSDLVRYQQFLAPTVIYAISTKKVKNIGTKWIPLQKALDNKAKELEKELPITEIKRIFAAKPWILEEQLDNIYEVITKNEKDIESESLFLQYKKRSDEISALCEKYKPHVPLLNKVNNINIVTSYSSYGEQPKKSGELYDLWTKVNERYPLLKFIAIPCGEKYNDKINKMVLNYIKNIDDEDIKTNGMEAQTSCPKSLIEKEIEEPEKKQEIKNLSDINLWNVNEFDIACLSKLGDLS